MGNLINALEAGEKLAKLNNQIDSLEIAYDKLWSTFDERGAALYLKDLIEELTIERDKLEDKLRTLYL